MTDTDPQSVPAGLPPSVQQMLRSLAGDMKFVGVMTVIFGVLSSLSIIGAVIGIPVIFGGIRLRDSGASFESYAVRADAAGLRTALELQGRYFRIVRILIIVGMVFTGAYILLLMIFLGAACGQ